MSEEAKDQRRRGLVRGKRGVRLDDGVLLLEPAGKPTHFTRAEIRRTVREVLAGRHKGVSRLPGRED